MNRRDKEMLATQWAKRRMRLIGANGERFTPHEAAHLAAIQYGLGLAAEMRVEKACDMAEWHARKRAEKLAEMNWPVQGAALTARLAA